MLVFFNMGYFLAAQKNSWITNKPKRPCIPLGHHSFADAAKRMLAEAQKASQAAYEAVLAAKQAAQEILDAAQRAVQVAAPGAAMKEEAKEGDAAEYESRGWLTATEMATRLGNFRLPKGKVNPGHLINDILCEQGLAARIGPEKQVQPCADGERFGRMFAVEKVHNGFTQHFRVCKWKAEAILPILRRALEDRGLYSQLQML